MNVENSLSGLIIIDKNKEVLLIQPTKKIQSNHKLYLHNLSKNYFVSTLFIQSVNDKKVMFDYNDFELDKKKQIFYRVRYDLETHKYIIRRENEKNLTDIFVSMEEEKRNERCKRVRKYLEV